MKPQATPVQAIPHQELRPDLISPDVHQHGSDARMALALQQSNPVTWKHPAVERLSHKEAERGGWEGHLTEVDPAAVASAHGQVEDLQRRQLWFLPTQQEGSGSNLDRGGSRL